MKRYLGQKPNTNVKQKTYGQFNVTIRTEQVQDKKKTINWAVKKYYNIKTSYVSILRLPSFYLYKLQTI
jgi:hypothetical protein